MKNIWVPSIDGMVKISGCFLPELNGRRIKSKGYNASWTRLGPPHLVIPQHHTGRLTGWIQWFGIVSHEYENPHITDHTSAVEVHWDDVSQWHENFCHHRNITYRNPCLIDIFMGHHLIPPDLLVLLDEHRNETDCVRDVLTNIIKHRTDILHHNLPPDRFAADVIMKTSSPSDQ